MPAAFTPVPDPDTRPLPAPVPPPPASPRFSPRWKRGLLVTPWFAAGAGFVIAAALSLNSPKTFLTYRPNAGAGTSTCADCQQAAVPTTARPGVQITSVRPAQPGGGGAAASTPAVRVRLGPEVNGLFSVTFLLPPGDSGHDWRVRFELPGRTVTQVVGAQWQPGAGQDGGVAAAPALGQAQYVSPYVSPISPGDVSFLISAGGTPVAPTGCLLDGRACHFT